MWALRVFCPSHESRWAPQSNSSSPKCLGFALLPPQRLFPSSCHKFGSIISRNILWGLESRPLFGPFHLASKLTGIFLTLCPCSRGAPPPNSIAYCKDRFTLGSKTRPRPKKLQNWAFLLAGSKVSHPWALH